MNYLVIRGHFVEKAWGDHSGDNLTKKGTLW